MAEQPVYRHLTRSFVAPPRLIAPAPEPEPSIRAVGGAGPLITMLVAAAAVLGGVVYALS